MYPQSVPELRFLLSDVTTKTSPVAGGGGGGGSGEGGIEGMIGGGEGLGGREGGGWEGVKGGGEGNVQGGMTQGTEPPEAPWIPT